MSIGNFQYSFTFFLNNKIWYYNDHTKEAYTLHELLFS